MERLEARAPFTKDDLPYLCQYFSVTPMDVLVGQTFEEKIQIRRLDEYLTARDSLTEAKKLLKKDEASTSEGSTTKTVTAEEDLSEEPTKTLTHGPPRLQLKVEASTSEGSTTNPHEPTMDLSNGEY
ncbi:hypothetical protein ACE6H2_020659 [Prunus campanulata]